MTTTAHAAPASPAPAAATPAEQTALPEGAHRRRPWRRLAVWLGLLAAAVGFVVAAALLRPAPPAELDPDNPATKGAKALAQVLRDHGVDIDVVRTIDSFENAQVDGSTTVLIVKPGGLSPTNADRALLATQGAARTVLLGSNSASLEAMNLPVRATVGWTSTPVKASCTSSIVKADESVTGGSYAYRTVATSTSWTRCFTADLPEGAASLLVGSRPDGTQLVIDGHAPNLTNEHIGQDANAALFVRLLGSTPHLVWYVPGPTDLADASASREKKVVYPVWFTPLVYLLGSGAVLLALVMGRRLGRLVTEPLPVVVRAVETTENRGRLYRRAADRHRTAQILQLGTRDRLRRRLGVGRGAAPSALVTAVAQVTGRPPTEVTELLSGTIADTDTALQTLARQLSDLEEQVRRQ